ncbi:MAG: DUF2207 domain-containing protein [Bacilli bacterium]|nr:DUF2207 domain-containing protein [Bacilli bacterium]MDD4407490.1 DUF2207 domain-containing protein [Bacilli bacterium]
MKKLFLTIFLVFSFIINVDADSINSIKMDIYIDNEGNANITETWDVNISKGTEGYKPYYNLGNSDIKDFTVTDDKNNLYKFVSNWNVNGSFSNKSYKNGFNYINNGIELCWGISKYGNRIYKLNYQITNFVADLNDNQMIYWTLIPYDLSPTPNEVEIVIRSDIKFSDDIAVWGYGNYGGTAYVDDGNIEMNNDGKLSSDEYMTILIKLPKGMFNTTNKIDQDFSYYFNMAEKDAVKYNSKKSSIIDIFENIFPYIIVIITIYFFKSRQNPAKRQNFKKIISKGKFPHDLSYYRDIACDKNIYYAFFLASSYKLNQKDADFLGAVLLDWVKKGYISIEKREEESIFKNKEETYIKLNRYALTNKDLESKMYNYMYSASKDGLLEAKEFEKYCKAHYKSILDWFDQVISEQKDICIEKKLLIVEKKMFTNYLETNDIYEEAKKLAGLKKFFEDFASMEDKSAIEVHLWEYYLQYAQIFGIAEKVASEFKKLYPDLITDINYNDIIFINIFSSNSTSAAYSKASHYTSGGGGFSSGGGGGGSFGGGGGGGFR